MTVTTHYDTLKITRDAPDEIIRAAYIALAQKYHPDRNVTNDEAGLLMQLVNIAYHALSHPQKKAEHDLWIAHQEASATAPQQGQKKPDAAADKAAADAAAWAAWAAKTGAEAKKAREHAARAAADAAGVLAAGDKARGKALTEQAAAEAKKAEEAEAAAAKAAAEAKKAAAKAGPIAAPQGGLFMTHYTVLKVTRKAPTEVIRAAYKALAQQYASAEKQADPATAQVVQTLNEAYSALSDPQKRASHDLWIQQHEPARQAPATAAQCREIREKAEKADSLAAAWMMLSETAAKEAKAAREKAAKAVKDAQANAGKSDHAKWVAWAAKLTAEADAAGQRAQKAATDLAAAKQAAREANISKEVAEKSAASDAAASAKERAAWDAAEKEERGK